MTDVVIKIENLSKYYRLGLIGGATLREDVERWWAKLRGKPDPYLPLDATDRGDRDSGEIWALRDVNLEVRRGEILGIIGRNGAGKSTLLKILSRITAPTTGRIKIKGRVGSLLEVGTGFHPELTGRENVYLNGAILGMTRAEVSQKLEEIVAFAEVERFVDTPVKRYSSGMMVRLAFAVAAHLEPEILVVDEVLAVGDASFQKKCLGKMGDVASHGRTVLFVSHNMAAVSALCGGVVWLDGGRVFQEGRSSELVEAYLRNSNETARIAGTAPVSNEFYGITVKNYRAALHRNKTGGVDLHVQLDVLSAKIRNNIGVGISIKSLGGVLIAKIAPSVTHLTTNLYEGEQAIVLRCPNLSRYLAGGEYILGFWLSIPKIEYLLSVEDAIPLSIPKTDVYGTGNEFNASDYGFVPLPVSLEHRTPARNCVDVC